MSIRYFFNSWNQFFFYCTFRSSVEPANTGRGDNRRRDDKIDIILAAVISTPGICQLNHDIGKSRTNDPRAWCLIPPSFPVQ